jgi:hypothetical protein
MFLVVVIAFFATYISPKYVYSTTGAKEAYVHIHVENGEGTREWREEWHCCGDAIIMNCKIVKLEVPNSIVTVDEDPNGNGWTIHGNIESVDLQRLLNNNWIDVPRDGINYHFSSAETLVIDECDDYPELVGRVIPLDGIITDNNGDFEVFVPVNN